MNVFKAFWKNSKEYFRNQKKVRLKEYFQDWSLWEKSWLAIATLAITVASVMTWDPTNLTASWVALISSITGIWCVILVAKGKISNYIWGLVNVVFYAWAAFSWKLYGDFMLNAFYFLPMQFIGWHLWVKPSAKKDNDTIKPKFLSGPARGLWAIGTIAGVVLYGGILSILGGLTPYLDATSTVLSVLAMVLMAKMFMEQWVLWIVVDIVTVVMWANIVFLEGGVFNMGILIMWVAFLVNAVYGLVNWVKLKHLEV